MTDLVVSPSLPERRLHFDGTRIDPSLEWLVTNGLGGYATAPVAGGMTRRYHGLLIAALPAPLGRIVIVNHLRATVTVGLPRAESRGEPVLLDHENQQADQSLNLARLVEFRLESGLPVWTYEVPGATIEKRLMMPHRQNTTQVAFRLLSSDGPVSLELRPMFHVRPHEDALSSSPAMPGLVTLRPGGAEVMLTRDLPPVCLLASREASLHFDQPGTHAVEYLEERARGHGDAGELWSPGWIAADLARMGTVTLEASTESWSTLKALPFDEAWQAELSRRTKLVDQAMPAARTGIGAELTLAADQFVISPATRTREAVVAKASGDEACTVIAGYHWFTDWGRDTMISLEGLTLTTGRVQEAGHILRTFGHHVKDGLIPNMFPEGQNSGLYHTADASLWFFHAIDRYLQIGNDRPTLRQLIPTLVEIIQKHLEGTRFGIGMDPADGLLRQGEEGYQLTWMDAKVDGWVVTPRRGKAVEINALWYSALCLIAQWLSEEGNEIDSRRYRECAERARESFNRRFWNDAAGYLFDVVDGEHGNDDSFRPNQLLAISLPNAVLAPERWEAVLEIIRSRLLTPVGLRSLAPGHPDYRPRYYGDLRTRDAAYHQGTVWGWLIGPFVDAWLKLRPDDLAGARAALNGFVPHLDQACIGSVSEIFDADSPFTPRGCIAQAWSVAELLRCWVKTS